MGLLSSVAASFLGAQGCLFLTLLSKGAGCYLETWAQPLLPSFSFCHYLGPEISWLPMDKMIPKPTYLQVNTWSGAAGGSDESRTCAALRCTWGRGIESLNLPQMVRRNICRSSCFCFCFFNLGEGEVREVWQSLVWAPLVVSVKRGAWACARWQNLSSIQPSTQIPAWELQGAPSFSEALCPFYNSPNNGKCYNHKH